MRDALWQLVRAGLSKLDPEFAHNLSIKALRTGLVPSGAVAPDPRLQVLTAVRAAVQNSATEAAG